MTFQRYETKYMLSPIMARKLRKSLPGHLQMDEYGLDTICSLYYDTPDHQLIRRSLEKPVYKEKLRLRSYGPVKETSPIYVELKKKYEGIVYKRRERMILSEAVPYLAGKSEPGFDSQILHEITWFRNYYRGLAPAMYIAYDRIACFGTEDRNFRVTFDTNIRWRTDNLCLDGPTEGTRPPTQVQRWDPGRLLQVPPLQMSFVSLHSSISTGEKNTICFNEHTCMKEVHK